MFSSSKTRIYTGIAVVVAGVLFSPQGILAGPASVVGSTAQDGNIVYLEFQHNAGQLSDAAFRTQVQARLVELGWSPDFTVVTQPTVIAQGVGSRSLERGMAGGGNTVLVKTLGANTTSDVVNEFAQQVLRAYPAGGADPVGPVAMLMPDGTIQAGFAMADVPIGSIPMQSILQAAATGQPLPAGITPQVLQTAIDNINTLEAVVNANPHLDINIGADKIFLDPATGQVHLTDANAISLTNPRSFTYELGVGTTELNLTGTMFGDAKYYCMAMWKDVLAGIKNLNPGQTINLPLMKFSDPTTTIPSVTVTDPQGDPIVDFEGLGADFTDGINTAQEAFLPGNRMDIKFPNSTYNPLTGEVANLANQVRTGSPTYLNNLANAPNALQNLGLDALTLEKLERVMQQSLDGGNTLPANTMYLNLPPSDLSVKVPPATPTDPTTFAVELQFVKPPSGEPAAQVAQDAIRGLRWSSIGKMGGVAGAYLIGPAIEGSMDYFVLHESGAQSLMNAGATLINPINLGTTTLCLYVPEAIPVVMAATAVYPPNAAGVYRLNVASGGGLEMGLAAGGANLPMVQAYLNYGHWIANLQDANAAAKKQYWSDLSAKYNGDPYKMWAADSLANTGLLAWNSWRNSVSGTYAFQVQNNTLHPIQMAINTNASLSTPGSASISAAQSAFTGSYVPSLPTVPAAVNGYRWMSQGSSALPSDYSAADPAAKEFLNNLNSSLSKGYRIPSPIQTLTDSRSRGMNALGQAGLTSDPTGSLPADLKTPVLSTADITNLGYSIRGSFIRPTWNALQTGLIPTPLQDLLGPDKVFHPQATNVGVTLPSQSYSSWQGVYDQAPNWSQYWSFLQPTLNPTGGSSSYDFGTFNSDSFQGTLWIQMSDVGGYIGGP